MMIVAVLLANLRKLYNSKYYITSKQLLIDFGYGLIISMIPNPFQKINWSFYTVYYQNKFPESFRFKQQTRCHILSPWSSCRIPCNIMFSIWKVLPDRYFCQYDSTFCSNKKSFHWKTRNLSTLLTPCPSAQVAIQFCTGN